MTCVKPHRNPATGYSARFTHARVDNVTAHATMEAISPYPVLFRSYHATIHDSPRTATHRPPGRRRAPSVSTRAGGHATGDLTPGCPLLSTSLTLLPCHWRPLAGVILETSPRAGDFPRTNGGPTAIYQAHQPEIPGATRGWPVGASALPILPSVAIWTSWKPPSWCGKRGGPQAWASEKA